MVIFNATFMIEESREQEFLDWLGMELPAKMPMGFGRNGWDYAPQVSAMREAGGVDYRQAEAQSIALQMRFEDIAAARLWGRGKFATLGARFEEKFGPQAMVFTSIFEVIDKD